jgi:threonine/homoserine/homoserine lactone efflux protein
MPDLSTIAAFSAATIALLLIPGPAVLYILNRSISDGRQVGLAAVAGLELGDLIQATAAAAGLSAVLAASATAFNIVKWAGAIYLIVTGIKTLKNRPAPIDPDQAGVSMKRAFRQGVIVNALNPKTALFFLSIFPQFVHVDEPHAGIQSMVLGAVFVVLATLFNGMYSLTASSLRHLLLRNGVLPFVRRYVSGVMFLGLGVLAATASAGHSAAATSD